MPPDQPGRLRCDAAPRCLAPALGQVSGRRLDAGLDWRFGRRRL